MGERQSEFEAVVLPHAPALVRFARRVCGADADDLTQEALLRAWRGLDSLRKESNPRAWLFRILLNAWHSEGRRKKARPEAPIHEAAMASAASSESHAEVHEALARLSVDQREVLLLAVVEGFTCREMAMVLGVPIGTVMSRLSRARAAMRDAMPGARKAGVNAR